jgi:mannose-6-phosphate isomerase-like protein (cupin superfamily)
MNSVIKYIQLPFKYNAEMLQREMSMLSGQWIRHFNTADYEGEWDALALHSYKGSINNIFPDISSSPDDFAYTAFAENCPYIKNIIQQFPGVKKSVRLLRLKPGAVIRAHRDRDLFFEKGEARIHIPIVTNEAVEFFIGGEQLHLRAGECWYLNFDLLHSIRNNGNTDRVHLVIDCVTDDKLKALFESIAPEHVKMHEVGPRFSEGERKQIQQELEKINSNLAKEWLQYI